MKKIYMIRHAKSSWQFDTLIDFDRPLDHEGHFTAKKMSEYFAQKNNKIDLIVSSSAQRAFTTASYFADEINIDIEKINKVSELYLCSNDDFLKIVQQTDNQANTICIFGHNPTFSDVAYEIMGDVVLFHEVPTCGIVEINLEVKSWSEANFENMILENYFFPSDILLNSSN